MSAENGARTRQDPGPLWNTFAEETIVPEIFTAYLITFGWAIVGSVSMGLGIIITLKMFTVSTRKVDEWELINQGNIPIAIILGSVIISLGLVIASAVHP